MGTSNLRNAKKAKNDEFYTQLEDVEKELIHYKDHFKDKVVYCNSDLVYESNFFKYFVMNFNNLGLKKLITTNYKHSPLTNKRLKPNKTYCSQITRVTETDNLETLFDNNANKLYELKGNGDFASGECIELLKEADIVVTNPPFSLFRNYIALLMEYNKDFLVIGNQNAIHYKGIFPLIKEKKVWLGVNSRLTRFEVKNPEEHSSKTSLKLDKKTGKAYMKLSNTCWFTTLDNKKEMKKLKLNKKYNSDEYPKYDNYNAINVDRVSEIPCDYEGLMGVPITFLNKYNPKQFKILGMAETPICYSNDKEARRIKKYFNVIQYKKGVDIGAGSKVNDVPTLLLKNQPKDKTYYKTDGVNGFLIAKYTRILIKHTEESLEEHN